MSIMIGPGITLGAGTSIVPLFVPFAELTPVNATYVDGVLTCTNLPGDWQSGASSVTAYTATWNLTLTMPTVSQYVFFGLNATPNPAAGDYSNQIFNWFVGGSDNTTINYGQAGVTNTVIPATNSVLTIAYDGADVTWAVNGTVVNTVAYAGGTALYAEILFTQATGANVTDVYFTGT